MEEFQKMQGAVLQLKSGKPRISILKNSYKIFENERGQNDDWRFGNDEVGSGVQTNVKSEDVNSSIKNVGNAKVLVNTEESRKM